MAVKKDATKPAAAVKKLRIVVPKDAKAARRRKWQRPETDMDTMVEHTWLSMEAFAADGARPPIIGIGPRPGTHTVCWFNESSGQYDNCLVVPD